MSTRRRVGGFLLVEAVLTAAVLGVGLVFITRSLSNHLGTLSRLQQYETLLRLAESQFAELEVNAQQDQLGKTRQGTFAAPYDAYQWKLQEADVQSTTISDELRLKVKLVTLTVSSQESPGPQVSLKTIWPVEWLQ